MKIRDMFIPYITVAVIVTALMFLFIGNDQAKAFLITYTIFYAVVMVYLAWNN
jgi:hypothetical protein